MAAVSEPGSEIDDIVTTEPERGPEQVRPHGASVLPFPSVGRRPEPIAEPAPRLRTVIGDVLRDERHAQERTLVDVADDAAVSVPYLSEVERGTKEVSSDLLAAICDSLGLELAEVLERSVRRLRPRSTGIESTIRLLAA